METRHQGPKNGWVLKGSWTKTVLRSIHNRGTGSLLRSKWQLFIRQHHHAPPDGKMAIFSSPHARYSRPTNAVASPSSSSPSSSWASLSSSSNRPRETMPHTNLTHTSPINPRWNFTVRNEQKQHRRWYTTMRTHTHSNSQGHTNPRGRNCDCVCECVSVSERDMRKRRKSFAAAQINRFSSPLLGWSLQHQRTHTHARTHPFLGPLFKKATTYRTTRPSPSQATTSIPRLTENV